MATLQTIEITLGEERLAPYQYEGFRVGPISVKVELQPDENPADVVKHVKTVLEPAWDELFIFMRDKFHEHRSMKM